MDSSRWVLDSTGQPILIPSFTDGTSANGSRKYKDMKLSISSLVLLQNMNSLKEL